ncbi:MAG: hypothetical protein WCY55_06665 [Anaerovoracaceae bacterium]
MDAPLQIAVCEDTQADAELLISHIAASGIDGRQTLAPAVFQIRPNARNLNIVDQRCSKFDQVHTIWELMAGDVPNSAKCTRFRIH